MERLNITPGLLRLAQTYLSADDDCDQGNTYCCHAICEAVGEPIGISPTGVAFEQLLRDWGFLKAGYHALNFYDPITDTNPPYTEEQGARFMLLELLALALEDGCLE